ncbi:hypothetical protein ACE6H2_007385 [Prunus campanulata]
MDTKLLYIQTMLSVNHPSPKHKHKHKHKNTISPNGAARRGTPCVTYLTSGGPPEACCKGVENIKAITQTTADRQQACEYFKAAGNRFPNVKEDAATTLPGKCGIASNIPYLKEHQLPELELRSPWPTGVSEEVEVGCRIRVMEEGGRHITLTNRALWMSEGEDLQPILETNRTKQMAT